MPAYVVFTDETLRELSRFRPGSLDAMSEIKGVGEKRLATYGEPFLSAISNYCSEAGFDTDAGSATSSAPPRKEDPPPQNASGAESATRSAKPRAFDLFRDGATLEAVQSETDRAMATVLGYLGEFIQLEGLTDPTPWIDESSYDRIRHASREAGMEKLKPIYEVLEGEISYETIRIALACLRNEVALTSSNGESSAE